MVTAASPLRLPGQKRLEWQLTGEEINKETQLYSGKRQLVTHSDTDEPLVTTLSDGRRPRRGHAPSGLHLRICVRSGQARVPSGRGVTPEEPAEPSGVMATPRTLLKEAVTK